MASKPPIKSRNRNRATTPAIDPEEFIDAKEQRPLEELSVEERVDKRAEGRYYQLINYRGTEEQKALIDYSAKAAGLSRQKLLEGIIMPELEKRYGVDFERNR